MGEYYKNVKLGTMDDWRYVRHEEIVNLHNTGVVAEGIVWALNPENQVLWRFPWPTEDNQDYTASNERDMFKDWTLPDGVCKGPETHKHVTLHVSDHYAYNINVFIPCPAGPDFAKSGLTSSQISHPVHIIGERYDADGNARTIFECAYCHQMFSLSDEEIEPVRKELLRIGKGEQYGRAQDKWMLEIANRLKSHQ